MQLEISSVTGLTGRITVPGDKSISHRAVILAALSNGESRIFNWLPSGDCWATVEALRALGVQIEVLEQTETGADLLVHGVGLRGFKNPDRPINCQGSGTTMRLLAGLLAGQPLDVILDGHEGLRRRPMERVARPLRRMGAQVDTTDGRPPIRIRGGDLTAIEFEMPIPSGQVKGAVLLAGLFAEGETVIHQPGPARDHTERMLVARALPIEMSGNMIRLKANQPEISPLDVTVPADFSSAAFPLVAALLVPQSELVIERVNFNETRTGLFEVLKEMQADITHLNETEESGEPLADLVVRYSSLKGIEVQGDTVVRMIDEFPILAVASTQANGKTIVRDATELRVKEIDRIKVTVEELRKMGAHMIACPDGYEVYGPTLLRGTRVDGHGDHRLAMALAVAGLVADETTVLKDAKVIDDSYPGFAAMLEAIGGKVALT